MPNHLKDKDVPRRRPNLVRPDGTVPAGWEPQLMRVEVVCETPGCENEGMHIVLDIGTNADGIDRVSCGGCKTWMDNITDTPGKAIGRY